MPSAMPATEPEPRAESTLIGMILAWNATPATPMPLWVDCAMVPATCVPWPWSSAALALSLTKFQPATNFASARSRHLGDAGVDDGDDDAVALRRFPRVEHVDLMQVPLLVEAWIVGEVLVLRDVVAVGDGFVGGVERVFGQAVDELEVGGFDVAVGAQRRQERWRRCPFRRCRSR